MLRACGALRMMGPRHNGDLLCGNREKPCGKTAVYAVQWKSVLSYTLSVADVLDARRARYTWSVCSFVITLTLCPSPLRPIRAVAVGLAPVGFAIRPWAASHTRANFYVCMLLDTFFRFPYFRQHPTHIRHSHAAAARVRHCFFAPHHRRFCTIFLWRFSSVRIRTAIICFNYF